MRLSVPRPAEVGLILSLPNGEGAARVISPAIGVRSVMAGREFLYRLFRAYAGQE